MTRQGTVIRHDILDSDSFAEMNDQEKLIWIGLLLIADDWGRISGSDSKISRQLNILYKNPLDISNAIKKFIDDGALEQYDVTVQSPAGHRAVTVRQLSNWEFYQARFKSRDSAKFPNKNGQFEGTTNPAAIARSSRKVTGRSPAGHQLKEKEKGKERERKEKEDLPNKNLLKEFCREIVPKSCGSPSGLMNQIKSLDKLIRKDKKTLDDQNMTDDQWREEIFATLRWARADNDVNDNWKGWNKVFQSIPRLRENGHKKFNNMRASYLSRNQTSNIARSESSAQLKARIVKMRADLEQEDPDHITPDWYALEDMEKRYKEMTK